MSKQIFYRNLVVLGFAVWFTTTAIFGWQIEPKSGVDNMFSTLGTILVGWGILGDLGSNLTFTKATNVKAHRVNIDIGGAKPSEEITL